MRYDGGRGVDLYAHAFQTLTHVKCEWSASRSGALSAV